MFVVLDFCFIISLLKSRGSLDACLLAAKCLRSPPRSPVVQRGPELFCHNARHKKRRRLCVCTERGINEPLIRLSFLATSGVIPIAVHDPCFVKTARRVHACAVRQRNSSVVGNGDGSLSVVSPPHGQSGGFFARQKFQSWLRKITHFSIIPIRGTGGR